MNSKILHRFKLNSRILHLQHRIRLQLIISCKKIIQGNNFYICYFYSYIPSLSIGDASMLYVFSGEVCLFISTSDEMLIRHDQRINVLIDRILIMNILKITVKFVKSCGALLVSLALFLATDWLLLSFEPA